jgi:hypothetical protein
MSTRTYSQTETDLAFQWVDKYFRLIDLILQISGDDENDVSLCMPSSERELQYQELRLWFFEHQDKFLPIWSEFWRNKTPTEDFGDNTDGVEYFKNPFLMMYKPDNLCQLAYRLGIIENIDTWETTEQAPDIIDDIIVGFSLEVLQFIHYIGEFADEQPKYHDD